MHMRVCLGMCVDTWEHVCPALPSLNMFIQQEPSSMYGFPRAAMTK